MQIIDLTEGDLANMGADELREVIDMIDLNRQSWVKFGVPVLTGTALNNVKARAEHYLRKAE